MQRAGRAGRNILIAARAILLVQPSVFQEVAAKKGAEDPDSVLFKKEVEAGLREWIETEECRRDVVDEYFDNGAARKRELIFFLYFACPYSFHSPDWDLL
jgi:superfamily II DNA helicase RecQ